MVQSIGHPVLYTQDSLIYSEPTTGKLGLPFVIKAFLFKHENISNVDVRIISTNYSENITLFDDGDHGDGNKNDGSFAGVWKSKDYPSFIGLENVKLTLNENQNILTLSATDCLPLGLSSLNINNTNNIIFAGYENNKGLSFFKEKANSLSGTILNIATKDNSRDIESVTEYFAKNNYNYYLLSKTINEPVKNTIINSVIDQCNFLFNKNNTENLTETKNIILFLDEDYPYCEKNNDFIHINPEFIIDESVTQSNITQDEFIDNFCKYAITKEQLQEKYLAERIPPHIEINNLVLNEQDNAEINLEFTIYDNKNESINYTVYLDLDHPLMYLKQNKTINGTKVNLNLTIPDGKHIMWIEAKDGKGNYDLSKAIPVEKKVNDFEVLIGSLDKIAYVNSPEIKFRVLHKESDYNLNYKVNINNDDTLIKGNTKPNIENSIPTNLPPGEYVIYITVTDQEGNQAHSWPYYIIVGTDQEPETYEAGIEWYEE